MVDVMVICESWPENFASRFFREFARYIAGRPQDLDDKLIVYCLHKKQEKIVTIYGSGCIINCTIIDRREDG